VRPSVEIDSTVSRRKSATLRFRARKAVDQFCPVTHRAKTKGCR